MNCIPQRLEIKALKIRYFIYLKDFWFKNEDAAHQASIYVKLFLADANGEKFTSSAGYEITKEKIRNLLEPNTWLCDQIVNTSIENIQFDESLIQLTDSFFYSELISPNRRLSLTKWQAIINTCRTWVMPVNFDHHWSLIILKNEKNRIDIACWDSLPTKLRLDKIKMQLLSSFEKNSMEAKAFSFSYNDDCYIQCDHNNCGIFLIGNIFAFLHNKNPCNLDLQNSRIAIARMILSSIHLTIN